MVDSTSGGVGGHGAPRPADTGARSGLGGAIFYTEFDGRRPKRLIIKVLGE